VKWQYRLWGAALALALGPVPLARGQEAAGPYKHFYNRNTFRIPVVIDEQERATLAELKLFVRPSGGEWTCAASASAAQKTFIFQAPRDGEYAFNIATVDKAGHMVPEDLKQSQPALVVIVDTQPPEVEVKPMTVASGQAYLQCRILDTNPDYASVKIQYQGVDGSWMPLEAVANAPGLVLVPNPSVLAGRIRVRAADRAGNVADREIDLSGGKAVVPARPMPPGISGADESPAPVRAVSEVRPGASAEAPLAPPQLDPPSGTVVVPPAAAPTTANKPMPVSPFPSDGGPLAPRTSAERAADPLPKPDLGADDKHPETGQMAVINSTRCRLDFALDPVPGGVAEVEVWATTDNGQSWKSVGVSKDGKSPAIVSFPGEGKYGIAFVIKPVSGLVSALPKPGEPLDGWIEVDTTLPTAELLGVTPGTGADTGFLILRWSAKDANLGGEPIAFWYASQPGGPWQLLSDHMANSGNYRWPLPKNIASCIWVRMEVRDRAGNVTRCETPQPVALEGPRARVRVLNVGAAKE
jgi:hypothetical protein